MGVIPALGFKTNVKDDEFAEEIARSIEAEFSRITYDENRDALSLNSSEGRINHVILDGHNEYVGMHHNALVFNYIPKDWPKWTEYSEKGSLMKEVRDFINEEFQHVEVGDLMPITPTT
jgi:hypothetical protein